MASEDDRTVLGFRNWLTDRFVLYLTAPVDYYEQRGWIDPDSLKKELRKGDVLLVEGNQRISAIIKYLTQSSWSHAGLYIGDELIKRGGSVAEQVREIFGDEANHLVVEALFEGVVASPVEKYLEFNVRIARPRRLQSGDLKLILDEAIASIGWRYDLRNVIELARHLAIAALRPHHTRRHGLRLGSHTATEVMCTSLLGRLFHQVDYPVLPSVSRPESSTPAKRTRLTDRLLRRPRPLDGVYRKRHPTQLTPRDFDLSPYFEIIKVSGIDPRRFDYRQIPWEDEPD